MLLRGRLVSLFKFKRATAAVTHEDAGKTAKKINHRWRFAGTQAHLDLLASTDVAQCATTLHELIFAGQGQQKGK